MSWTLIESQTLGSSAASVTFSNIPQTFKTLKLVVSSRTDRSIGTISNLMLTVNGSSASYSDRWLQGNGTAASSGSAASTGINDSPLNQATDTASVFSSHEFLLPNYAGSAYKVLSVDAVTENNATLAFQQMLAGLWSSTSAITSITLTPFNSPTFSLLSGSSFYLYGLK